MLFFCVGQKLSLAVCYVTTKKISCCETVALDSNGDTSMVFLLILLRRCAWLPSACCTQHGDKHGPEKSRTHFQCRIRNAIYAINLPNLGWVYTTIYNPIYDDFGDGFFMAGWWFGTFFYFFIDRKESSQLTNIFQRGWNHQLDWI